MVEVTVFNQCLILVSVVLVSLISLVIVCVVCSDMQDAAGNIFFDRSGIRRYLDHSVINLLVGIFVIFQVVF